MKGDGEGQGPRRIGPLAVAVGLALLIPLGVGARALVGQLTARHTTSPVAVVTPDVIPPNDQVVPTRTPRPDDAPTPTPTPYVSPAQLVSTVVSGGPLIWYTSMQNQAPNPLRLEAVDWNGVHRGHIDVPDGTRPTTGNASLGVMQSPDGQRIYVDNAVYGADGHLQFRVDLPGYGARWSEDGRSLCSLREDVGPPANQAPTRREPTPAQPPPPTVSWHLVVASVGHVSDLRLQLDPVALGDASYILLGCSTTRDRAVIYRLVEMSMPHVTVVRISTGAVLLNEDTCSGTCGRAPLDVTVTPDTRRAAESTPDGTVRIRDLVTGRSSPVAQRGDVVALSPDGAHLLLSASQITPSPDRVALVDLASGRVLWSRGHAVAYPRDALWRAGATSIAVAWRSTPPDPSPDAHGDYPPPPPAILELLAPDGSGVRDVTVTGGVYSMWATAF